MLDEPSLGLAPALVDQIFELIVRLHQRGVTILLVEQNVERTLEIVDRAYLLQHRPDRERRARPSSSRARAISKASTWASDARREIGARLDQRWNSSSTPSAWAACMP